MDKRFSFPAPEGAVYILTLHGHCLNCDSPAGISIERIDSTHILWDEYQEGEYVDGPLTFEQWPDSHGVAIVTGMRRHEFIKAVMRHLIGINSNELGENGVIDEAGADVIAEEMYEDAQVRPSLLTASAVKEATAPPAREAP